MGMQSGYKARPCKERRTRQMVVYMGEEEKLAIDDFCETHGMSFQQLFFNAYRHYITTKQWELNTDANS